MRSRAREEAVRRRCDEERQASLRLGRIKTATHEIDAGEFRSGGFLGRLHVDVGEDAFAFELLQFVDGVFLAGA